jgi:hypothetical protein
METAALTATHALRKESCAAAVAAPNVARITIVFPTLSRQFPTRFASLTPAMPANA